MKNSRTVRGLTWIDTERASEGDPIWKLDLPSPIPHLVLKNYGRFDEDPGSPFSGIRLVSGGPFTEAGRWKTMDEAMFDVQPYIKGYLSDVIDEKRAEYEELLAAMNRVEKVIK